MIGGGQEENEVYAFSSLITFIFLILSHHPLSPSIQTSLSLIPSRRSEIETFLSDLSELMSRMMVVIAVIAPFPSFSS